MSLLHGTGTPPQISDLFRKAPFTLLVGAGISVLPPASSPTWRAMLKGFGSALFERMRSEGWNASETFAADIKELVAFDYRPESFWETVLTGTTPTFVAEALPRRASRAAKRESCCDRHPS